MKKVIVRQEIQTINQNFSFGFGILPLLVRIGEGLQIGSITA